MVTQHSGDVLEKRTIKASRRWLRFSLRTMLVLVTAFGVWLGIKVDEARRQKAAVEKLQALGVEVWYEHQRTANGGFDVRIDLAVPDWARDLCGDHFFQTVKGLFYVRRLGAGVTPEMSNPITDADLKCLADLPHLEQLIISRAPITDAGLAHLRHPERLRVVAIYMTQVGDSFVRRLKNAGRLESLVLDETQVTDDALAELTNLPHLQVLGLQHTDTGDRALAPFAACELISLSLGRNTTNAGLQQFKTLSKVQILDAGGCSITGNALSGFRLPVALEVRLSKCNIADNDLATLADAVRDVPNLELNDCLLTDRGLPHLYKLKKLTRIALRGTGVTAEGIAKLQQAIPGLKVAWDGEFAPVDLSGDGSNAKEEP
jgi:hypothetical protein